MATGIIYRTTLSVFSGDSNNNMYQGMILSSTEAYYVGTAKEVYGTSPFNFNKQLGYIMAISLSASCL